MRHRTLKWKFTVTFISMMALAVTATWCINNWFLEGYYQNYKIGVLEKGYHAIDTIVLEEKKTEEALWRARKMSLTVPLIFYCRKSGCGKAEPGAKLSGRRAG